MDTNAYTQTIRSPELKVLFDSIGTALCVPDDPENLSFAKSLMKASHSEETVSKIQLLSEKIDLKIIDNVSGEEDPGTICVFYVDVFLEKDHLQVVKRDPDHWINASHLRNEEILKIIFVHSKSLRVIETKLRVYREYESLFRSKMLHIQHEYEDFDDIAKKSANEKAMSIQRTIQSLIKSIPSEELDIIFNEAARRALSRENIRNICFNEFITDGEDVGTVKSGGYVCRFFVTVRRIEAQLVTNTWRSVGKSLSSEIYKGILLHIESKIQSAIKQDLIKLRFHFSEEIFATVNDGMLYFIISVINLFIYGPLALVLLVLTFVFPVDVNSKSWRGQVADRISFTVSEKDVISKLLPIVKETCRKTTGDLKNVSKKLAEWTQKTECMDIKEMVSFWKQREAVKNISGLSNYPSVLNLIAGLKDNKPTLKVILSHEDEEAKFFFKNRNGIPEKVEFIVVSSKSKKRARAEEKKPHSSDRIDQNEREKIGKIVKRQGERLFASHSSIVGLGIGNMDPGKIPCIIIYCLDKNLIPFGEKPIPKMLEGCSCDIREDIIMFGACFDCHGIDHPNYGCCIGLLSNGYGSAGFLVKTIGSDIEASGFLTAAHVAAENWRDLYYKKSLLSQLDIGECGQEIVHPLSPNNTNGQRIGKVQESFCGNWGPEEIGIDAAFVQNYKPKKAEFRELRLAEENELNYNDQLIVLKRGGATGETFGRLLNGSCSPCVNPRVDDIAWRMGGFYFFESCFAVEDIDDQFFDLGDSGSGVFLTENRNPTKPLGIAFAKLDFEPITFVCRINQVAEAFNLRVYEILEPMEIDHN